MDALGDEVKLATHVTWRSHIMRGPTIRIACALLMLTGLIACQAGPSTHASRPVTADATTPSVTRPAPKLSAQDLARRTIERRAVEAVIWGMPAVNAELMFQAVHEAKGDFNQVVYWSRRKRGGWRWPRDLLAGADPDLVPASAPCPSWCSERPLRRARSFRRWMVGERPPYEDRFRGLIRVA